MKVENELTLSPVTLKDSTLPWERQVGFIPVNKCDGAFLVEEFGEEWGEVWEEHAELGTLRYIDADCMLDMVGFGTKINLIK